MLPCVGKDLDFDVARTLDPLLDQQMTVAKGGFRLAPAGFR